MRHRANGVFVARSDRARSDPLIRNGDNPPRLTCAAMASVVLWFDELRKLLAGALRGERAMKPVHPAGRDIER